MRTDDLSMRILSQGGRAIRSKLKRYYGSAEAAAKAVHERMEDVAAIEGWATIVQNTREIEEREEFKRRGETFYPVAADLRGGPWEFGFIPQPLRDTALQSMAAAMLAWEIDADDQRGDRALR